MQLHLVLPGLLWPRKVLRDTASDLDLPALSWLLGRGHLSWLPPHAPESPESALCRAFGLDGAAPPYAALRLLGEGAPPGDDVWLCADPVHLSIEQRRVTLANNAPPASPEEIREIVSALSPHFAEVGEFVAGADGHGYLRLTQMPDIATVPPSIAAGYDAMLPQGANATLWRRLGNEAQMLMHALPCNELRERNGQPRLNSLWFWGPGRLPPSPSVIYERICGDDPVLRGLARLTGIPLESASRADALLQRPHGRVLLLLDPLLAPTRTYDALRWREALLELEHTWLKPLLAALRTGRLRSLRLTALGDEAGFDLVLKHGDLLRFWRRPMPLHELMPAATKP